MPGWKSLSGSTRNCLHQDGKPIFFTSLPPRRSRQFLVAGFPADCRRVLPAASSESISAKAPQKPNFLSPVILIFPWGKTEGNDIRNGEENFSLPLRVRHAGGMRIASTEPAGENGALIVCHRHTGPLFSCKRGPLGKHPTGIFPNSPPKMRPAERVFRPLRWAAKGLCPFGCPAIF